ncbi:hypothetical protein B0J11DRAFT_503633 [Dendryphion nanum]|uniref:Uncharacterized protein n=1 Tax=Dendryphion nanum TaxID=256645 RepID=A0A9P9E8B2_9PLEO|nr:hypothetical protein B0J11DRAFT_503633 [Dendryphion nanum]
MTTSSHTHRCEHPEPLSQPRKIHSPSQKNKTNSISTLLDMSDDDYNTLPVPPNTPLALERCPRGLTNKAEYDSYWDTDFDLFHDFPVVDDTVDKLFRILKFVVNVAGCACLLVLLYSFAWMYIRCTQAAIDYLTLNHKPPHSTSRSVTTTLNYYRDPEDDSSFILVLFGGDPEI